MRVPYRKVFEVIGVTTEQGEFFCVPCVESLGVAEACDRPVFLGDEHEGFTCDRCGVLSSEL